MFVRVLFGENLEKNILVKSKVTQAPATLTTIGSETVDFLTTDIVTIDFDTKEKSTFTSEGLRLILEARHHDPFSFLGLHKINENRYLLRTFLPQATSAWVKFNSVWVALEKTHIDGLFEHTSKIELDIPCLIKIESENNTYEAYDAYTFSSSITQDELYLFSEGRLKQAYKMLGAQCILQNDIAGVRFAVWAPNAERVSVTGSFNNWDGRVHSMRAHGASGVWEIFIPHLTTHDTYKFEIRKFAWSERPASGSVGVVLSCLSALSAFFAVK